MKVIDYLFFKFYKFWQRSSIPGNINLCSYFTSFCILEL